MGLPYWLQWFIQEKTRSDSIEQLYDDLSAKKQYELSINYHQRVESLRPVFAHLDSGMRVLDLACGTGAVIDALPGKESLQVTGIDITEGMLKEARHRFAKYNHFTFHKKSFFDIQFIHN